MQSMMNIQVRVISAGAQGQIKALQARVAQLEAQLARANRTAATGAAFGGGNVMGRNLASFGNRLQWTGRQIQYNWTLPLLLAGGLATKWALENEKAMTRVTKVYGDATEAGAYYNKQLGLSADNQAGLTKANQVFQNELDALGNAFEALSSHYGVHQKEVLETAGAWAAAGVSGKALAESTELSLKAAILGDMELAKATESLIAIQSQYSLSTKDLNLALADLNAIENQTGISMQGLIDGFARSAGVAREAGVDVRHLGAMLAALVPATGTAATAGNALKTIISRLMSPTGDAAAVMKEFGINTADAAWQSSTAMERLLVLAQHMKDTLNETGNATKDTADDMYELSDSQKQVVATVLGSRYQMNRFLVLMRELAEEHGYYQKALDATADNEKAFAQMDKELQAVLESNPKRLEILWNTIRNGMSSAIQPLIPYLLYMVNVLRMMIDAFKNLDPSFQKLFLWIAVLIGVVGPLLRYIGSSITLFYFLGKALVFASLAIFRLVGAKYALTLATRTLTIGLGTLITTMLALPFRVVAFAIGALIGSMVRLAVVSGLAPVFAKAWALAIALVSGGLATFFRLTGLYAVKSVALWAGSLASMLAMATLSYGLILARAAGFYGSMIALGVVSQALIAARWLAHNSVMLAIQGAWLAASVGLQVVWQRLMVAALLVWTRISFALFVGWRGVTLAIQGAWLAASVAMQILWGRLWNAATIAAGTAYAATLAAIRTAGVAIWGSMLAVKAAMSQAFWTRVIALYLAGGMQLKKIMVAMRAILLGPWGVAIAAVVAILYYFWDEVVQIWNNIISYFSDTNNSFIQAVLSAWNALPSGIANALTAVARIVADAAMFIYEMFSYINPFARHSPSLVENVQRGMKVIKDEFAGLSSIGAHIKGAYRDIKSFGNAVAGLLKGATSFQFLEDLANIKKFAPGAADEFLQLNNRLGQLNRDLAVMEQRVAGQERVVARWQARLDEANRALDVQQDKLDKLSQRQQRWQEALDEANSRLQYFANAPIQGMGEMSDRIFENEMAQKRLRLEMMRMEEVTGPLDDVRSKIEAINGAQELLRGKQADLREGGAGGDILKTYQDEIDALDKQRQAYDDASAPLQKMQDQLDALQRKGEELDLVNSLQFDPLTRQIEAAANAMEEMPFEDIIAGVRGAQADIALYEDRLASATEAVAAQQAVVDMLAAARDRMQASLDAESDKLDRIKDKYDRVAEAIRDVESTMRDAVSAAESMARAQEAAARAGNKSEYVSPAVQNFRDAANGNFTDVSGAGIPTRKDWEDQSKAIQEYADSLAKDTAFAFGELNPFGGIQDKWNDFKAWWNGIWPPLVGGVKDMFSNVFGGTSLGKLNIDTSSLKGVTDQLKQMWKGAQSVIQTIVTWAGRIWRLFWPSIKEIAQNAFKALRKVFGDIWFEIKKIWEELGPLVQQLARVLKPVLAFIIARLTFVGKVIFSVVAKVIGPAIETFGGIFSNLLQVIRGVIQVITGLIMIFSSDWKEGFKKLGSGLLNIVSGIFGAIGNLFKGAFKILVGIVWGIVKGIFDWFKWLWDELVGHSIIPDIINGIVFWFQKLIEIAAWVFNNVVKPVLDAFMWLFDKVIEGLGLWWRGITAAFEVLTTLGKWFWNNILEPVLERVKALWPLVKASFRLWWAGVKLVWGTLKTLGKWFWDHILKPVLDRVRDLWPLVKGALQTWWNGIVTTWNTLKTLGKWVWDHVLKPVWDRFSTAFDRVKNIVIDAKNSIVSTFDKIKSGVGDVIQFIKDTPGKIKDLGGKFLEAGAHIIQKLIDGFTSVKDVMGDIAGTLWDFLKDVIDDTLLKPLADALTFTVKIGPWEKSFDFGKFVPRLYTGGIIKGSREGMLAVIGDKGYDEAVIPLNGPNSPFNRLNKASSESSMRSDIIGPSGTTKIINIYGNLEFPNIKNGEDMEDFIDSLEDLAG